MKALLLNTRKDIEDDNVRNIVFSPVATNRRAFAARSTERNAHRGRLQHHSYAEQPLWNTLENGPGPRSPVPLSWSRILTHGAKQVSARP